MTNALAGLAARLAARIRAEGPLGVDAFMAAALTDPAGGYYTRRDPLGEAGDFTTAPEISQMFGELIGAWCIDCWHAMECPDPFALAELGPGRGTLMADLLRAARVDPAFIAAARLHLVEASPALRTAQKSALAGHDVAWHDDAAGLPDLPLLLVANEFFDALPIRQFERTDAGWCERRIGLADATDAVPRFVFTLSPPLDPGPLPAPDDAPAGAIAETSPTGRALAADLAARLVAYGGAALIVDYGYARGHGDTLQAVRGHRYAAALADPGEADLTAHVDFSALAAAARAAGAAAYGPVDQGAWLRALGIEARAAALMTAASADQRHDIAAALRRLIDPAEMGTLFKAMAFATPNLPAPAGFTV